MLGLSPLFDLHLSFADSASGALAMSHLGLEFGFLPWPSGASVAVAVDMAVAGPGLPPSSPPSA